MLTMHYTKKIEEAQTVQEQYYCVFIYIILPATIFVFRKANVNKFREVLSKVTMAGMLGSYNMQKSWECLTNKP